MPALQPQDRSRCYFHCGYGNGEGIPAADVARLEQAMDRLRDSYQLTRVVEILDILDECWLRMMPSTSIKIDSVELIAGDTNRSVQRGSRRDGQKNVNAEYLNWTDLLCQELWIPNYRRQESLRFRLERSAGEFIHMIPGPADTAIASSLADYTRLGGSFGFAL